VSEAIETAFIDAIRKNPDDDDARAVYADWLEEHGDARGEYLRLEAQLNRIPLRLIELARAINPLWLEAVARRYDVELISAGSNKIMAIKSIRAATGLGLKDAKDIADRASELTPQRIQQQLDRKRADAIIAEFTGSGATLRIVASAQARATIDGSVFEGPGLAPPGTAGPGTEVVLVSVAPNQLISAIRLVREITALGLKDAKDIVDRVAAGTPHTLVRFANAVLAAQIVARFAGIGQVDIR
jgi:uncharacterized protein (TIGR02996 family)